MTRSRFALLLVSILTFLVAVPARADRVRLTNGSVLRGKIVREDKSEIDLELDDGMRMTIRRSRIESVERDAVSGPGSSPDPAPGGEPETATPSPSPGGKEGEEKALPHTGPAQFFDGEPGVDWDLRFGRYPVLVAAKTTQFRAYEFSSQDPLAIDPGDTQFAEAVREHGHGGSLSVWQFRYSGNLDLRYGDEVKIVAEITAPPDDEEMLLLRLRQGPQPYTDRVVVMLVRRRHETKRFATTATFTSRDFRTSDIAALERRPMPVRAYTVRYEPVAESWLLPEESEFLRDIQSPFGNSIRIRLARFRFRLDWFAAPAEGRAPLDPDLLERDAVKPVALPGRPVASEDEVVRLWGSEAVNQERLGNLLKEVREALGRVGVRPGSDYYVEQDRVGMLGRRGITIETRRHILTRDLLETLTRK